MSCLTHLAFVHFTSLITSMSFTCVLLTLQCVYKSQCSPCILLSSSYIFVSLGLFFIHLCSGSFLLLDLFASVKHFGFSPHVWVFLFLNKHIWGELALSATATKLCHTCGLAQNYCEACLVTEGCVWLKKTVSSMRAVFDSFKSSLSLNTLLLTCGGFHWQI